MSDKDIDAYYQSSARSLDDLKKAIEYLDKDKDAEDRWVRLDAVAKRFEVSFEYFWKFLKAAGEYQGSEVLGPRPAILEAARYGWIENKENWAGFLEARDAGVRDCFGLSSEEYAEIARSFLIAANECIIRIKHELFPDKV